MIYVYIYVADCMFMFDDFVMMAAVSFVAELLCYLKMNAVSLTLVLDNLKQGITITK